MFPRSKIRMLQSYGFSPAAGEIQRALSATPFALTLVEGQILRML